MPISSVLVRQGMKKATQAYHKLGYNGVCDLHPACREAFNLLDEAILDLKEGLGYERTGDWIKKEDS